MLSWLPSGMTFYSGVQEGPFPSLQVPYQGCFLQRDYVILLLEFRASRKLSKSYRPGLEVNGKLSQSRGGGVAEFLEAQPDLAIGPRDERKAPRKNQRQMEQGGTMLDETNCAVYIQGTELVTCSALGCWSRNKADTIHIYTNSSTLYTKYNFLINLL